MEFTAMDRLNQKQENDTHLLRMLDRGIDDMEAKRELPLEDLLQANIYNSVYQKTVHIRLCVGSLPTAQPYLNIASFPTYYNAYHSDLLDMFSCTNPPQIPILMFLLYHNDTIIKKEKELLRALLSQFCKLESVIYHPNY